MTIIIQQVSDQRDRTGCLPLLAANIKGVCLQQVPGQVQNTLIIHANPFVYRVVEEGRKLNRLLKDQKIKGHACYLFPKIASSLELPGMLGQKVYISHRLLVTNLI